MRFQGRHHSRRFASSEEQQFFNAVPLTLFLQRMKSRNLLLISRHDQLSASFVFDPVLF